MADENTTGIRPTQPPVHDKPPGYIGDFGEKIGGARKDLRGNVTRDDIEKMTPEERLRLVVKGTVWPTPDWESLVREGGYTQKAALLVKLIRDSFPPGPIYPKDADEARKTKAALAYNTLLNVAKDACEKARTELELGNVLRASPEVQAHLTQLPERNGPRMGYYTEPSKAAPNFSRHVDEAFLGDRGAARDILFALRCANEGVLDRTSGNVLRRNPNWPSGTSQVDTWLRSNRLSTIADGDAWVIAYAERSSADPRFSGWLEKFGLKDEIGKRYEDKEKADAALRAVAEANFAKKRDASKAKRDAVAARALGKPVDAPSPMIGRVGGNWRQDRQVIGEDYLTTFGMRGGEWGNYVPQKMRPDLLNKGFDSLCDLADALRLPREAISLGGHLAIAFGARGRGGFAAAHYEPDRKVFNLTKSNGAGCVAHEVGHAIDHFLGCKAQELGLAAQVHDSSNFAFLSNMALKPSVSPEAMSEQEKLIRDLHKAFDAIWLNPDPITKAELVEAAEARRARSLAALNAMVNHTEGYMGMPNIPAEERERFAQFAHKVRNPEVGKEMDSFTDGVVGMVHIPAVQRSSYSSGLQTVLVNVRANLEECTRKRALPENHTEMPSRPRKTEYLLAVQKIDADRSKPYYSKREEMVARTIEAVVIDALREKGHYNHFLVDGADGEAFPQGLEREKHSRNLLPLFERLPGLMPELTVVPVRSQPAKPATPTPPKELAGVAADQMSLF